MARKVSSIPPSTPPDTAVDGDSKVVQLFDPAKTDPMVLAVIASRASAERLREMVARLEVSRRPEQSVSFDHDAPRVLSPVTVRTLTTEQRAEGGKRGTEALTRYIAAEENRLATLRSMLVVAQNTGETIFFEGDSKWVSALFTLESAVHCSDCGHIDETHDAMIDDLRAMSGHLVSVSGGSATDSGAFRPIRLEYARAMIEDYGAADAESLARVTG